jgi:hypothetical protein
MEKHKNYQIGNKEDGGERLTDFEIVNMLENAKRKADIKDIKSVDPVEYAFHQGYITALEIILKKW